MLLKPFNPDKDLKKINRRYTKKQLITTLLVLFVMITIGTSYAIFSIQPEYHTFLKSQVGEFSTGDIKLSVLVEGIAQSDFPAKDTGYAFESVTCDNGSTGTWDANEWQLTLAAKGPDKCTISFISGITLSNYIVNLYNSAEESSQGLYYHDGQGIYANASLEAKDNSYRYSGPNPNNYVCFGTDEENCPIENLYRIIGVFDSQVKLIKSDFTTTTINGNDGSYYGPYGAATNYIGNLDPLTNLASYYWNNSTSNNTWSTSNLNIVNLNTNFINYLDSKNSKWVNMISEHTWQVGGGSGTYLYNSPVHITYQYELGANKTNITYKAKIGLMYISDYGYATTPEYWNINMSNYNDTNVRNNNWMWMRLTEWTISRDADTSSNAFGIGSSGNVGSDNVVAYGDGIRPTFYLDASTLLISGTGQVNDPYIIG